MISHRELTPSNAVWQRKSLLKTQGWRYKVTSLSLTWRVPLPLTTNQTSAPPSTSLKQSQSQTSALLPNKFSIMKAPSKVRRFWTKMTAAWCKQWEGTEWAKWSPMRYSTAALECQISLRLLWAYIWFQGLHQTLKSRNLPSRWKRYPEYWFHLTRNSCRCRWKNKRAQDTNQPRKTLTQLSRGTK